MIEKTISEPMKYSLHALHDVAGAIWFGGNFFGTMALNPGVRAATNPHERGAVLNQAWENFAPYSVASGLLLGATWAGIRFTEPRLQSGPSRDIARLRDWLTVGAVTGTVVSGALNRVIASDKRVPVESGLTPITDSENDGENTPPHIAKAQIAMRFVAAADLLIGAGLLVTGAILEQQVMDDIARKPAFGLPGKFALDAVKTVAAAELVRRASKLIGESIDALRPHEPTTAERLKNGALDLYQRAAELVGVKQQPVAKSDPLSKATAGLAAAFDSASSLFSNKEKELELENIPTRNGWQRVTNVFAR